MRKVIIIGGGMAGLILAIRLIRLGIRSLVIEKKEYPFHRVCGEYISNEVVPFLNTLDLYPIHLAPPQISRFMLSSVSGRYAVIPLDLGGFGVSRYAFDHYLYERAAKLGVEFLLSTEVEDVVWQYSKFEVITQNNVLEADLVVGAFGKRSKIDLKLERNFIRKRSPYVGIKYHVRTDHAPDLISLHNFKGGYCGMSNVEEGRTNLCYMTHRDNLRRFKDIDEMEENILYQNPLLKDIFLNADFIFQKPEVINEISFDAKLPVENHILMVGDAAGMVAPLCGNGMAMSIRAAKIASEWIARYCIGDISREQMEHRYTQEWHKEFSKRLWAGRQIQRLFGGGMASNLSVSLVRYCKPVARTIIHHTHGATF